MPDYFISALTTTLSYLASATLTIILIASLIVLTMLAEIDGFVKRRNRR